MLTGNPPFYGKTIDEVLQLNLKNKITFDKFPWVSEEARSLILKLTHFNPYFRPNATDALHDPWISKNMNQINLKNNKDIAKENKSNCKFDSYSFYKEMAKEIPNEFANLVEFNTAKSMRTCGHTLKVNRVPDFDPKNNRISCDREYLLKSGQFHRFTRGNFKSYSLRKNRNNLSNDGIFSEGSSINRVSESTSSDALRIKTRSTFALKALANTNNICID